MAEAPSRPVFWNEIRILLLAAMAVFIYTIVIGILNGTDAVEFDRKRVLGHVHGGTLGWLTLAVFAASLWLFGESRAAFDRERMFIRGLIAVAIVSFVAYTAAFSLTYGNWRPILGIVATIAIGAFFAWVVWRSVSQTLGVPHWGFLAALGTSVTGGVLGVLLGLQIATGDQWLPDGGDDAHPATMVVGFLVPISMAMVEWAFFFPRPPAATRLGKIQMIFPFLGGVLLMIAILLDQDALAPPAIILEIIGLVILLIRMWPWVKPMEWLPATPQRHAVMGMVAVLFAIGLAQYFIIKYDGDFDLVPAHQLLALDHSQFIGAVTNSLFAMIMLATIGARGNRFDQAIFFLVNVGLVLFVIGLLSDTDPWKHAGTPLMGAGLLLGIGTYTYRLLPELFSREPAAGTRAVPAK